MWNNDKLFWDHSCISVTVCKYAVSRVQNTLQTQRIVWDEWHCQAFSKWWDLTHNPHPSTLMRRNFKSVFARQPCTNLSLKPINQRWWIFRDIISRESVALLGVCIASKAWAEWTRALITACIWKLKETINLLWQGYICIYTLMLLSGGGADGGLT